MVREQFRMVRKECNHYTDRQAQFTLPVERLLWLEFCFDFWTLITMAH